MLSPSPSRLPWGTLRARLAIWNTAVVLSMTVATLVAVRLAAWTTIYDRADDELRSGAQEVVLAMEALFPDMDAVVAELRRKAASHEKRGWFTQLLREDGTNVWTSEHCPEEVAAFPPRYLDRVENIAQVGQYRYVRLRIELPNQPAFHVRVGTYTTGLDESLTGLMRMLAGFGAVICALTPLAGWWLAVLSTRPVADILSTANRLQPSHLEDRLPVRGTGDELDTLARTINGLLDDVAAHVARQQDFVADAAHELRSPLAAVQSMLEVAISKERSADDYREALADVLEEARHLTKLANALLTLAETGTAARTHLREPVDLAVLVRQSAGMFAGAAEERGIRLEVETEAVARVPGDPDQLRQVVGNLLDNAIRFTPPGGRIVVTVVRSAVVPDAAVLTVADTGGGIAPQHLGRLFDRFFKADAARARDGTSRSGGLGLPICKSLVEMHGGSISVASTLGRGTTVTVRLPALAPAAAIPS
jgi:heavy metal sensor kinase